jgi:NTP pyrophosphatase (non-canonical NTP hydrolase)
MLVADYDKFVRRTDQYSGRGQAQRREIAIYGIAGEIGSLLSAIKKKLLAEDGEKAWNSWNDEIVQELGDVIWYCFSLAQILGARNILISDIARLKRQLEGKDEFANRFRQALDSIDPAKKATFIAAAENFPKTADLTFTHYQSLAFVTARTEGRVLLKVCLAVLWQLGAELLRVTLPSVEKDINTNIADRNPSHVLGEIAWHLAAVASLYGLSLDVIVEENVKKVSFRSDRTNRTPLHDLHAHLDEQFPRRFEVAFVSIGKGKTAMVWEGRRLGDPLTDNFYEDDGYRFHDVMHLSNVAHLGWSPVLRRLMDLKRKKSGDKLDEVEDGARAALVEEVVLKAIHSEGKRLVGEQGPASDKNAERQFATREQISFRLLKSLQEQVEGLEVRQNKSWEWEDAIFHGARVYHELRSEGQGTVTVDLTKHTLCFDRHVVLDLRGQVAGMGAFLSTETDTVAARAIAAKRAILSSLGFKQPTTVQIDGLEMMLYPDDKVAVKTQGEVQERMWERGALAFQLAFSDMPTGTYCTAIAISDA